ncbi:hypothetical protein MRX96_057769 [Rhipicephalus microplus]
MSFERTETSKQELRQESTGGEREALEAKALEANITTQGTPAQVHNEVQPSNSRGKSQDRALESLNTPGTTSETSTTTLGVIPPKDQSRECGETRIATSEEASARWTDASS